MCSTLRRVSEHLSAYVLTLYAVHLRALLLLPAHSVLWEWGAQPDLHTSLQCSIRLLHKGFSHVIARAAVTAACTGLYRPA